MSARSFAFLVNPASGGGAAPGAVVPVARALREAGADVEVTYSPGPAAMAQLVADAVAAGRVVVSVGGDGMLASLAGPVAAAGGTLALVPAGRGNDFARMLGIPDDAEGQARVLLTGAPRPVDLISWQLPGAPERLVAGSVYAGVDARAAEIVDGAHRLPKATQYPYAALRALATYRPARARVVVDGEAHEVAASNIVLANSAFYGKGMKVAPGAVVDDGLLEVILIEASSKLTLIRALPTIYGGEHVHRPEVTVLRGRRIEVHADGARGPVPVGGDGESLGHLPARDAAPAVAEVRPGALTVLLP
ncbi:diacylglycerol kinase family protein [Nocardioides sp.]|uniref:diacylglycerol/lipid kinase family protein n=1 Tax=Nocardioides sp. TaxID=35761 RepID=UPI003511437E